MVETLLVIQVLLALESWFPRTLDLARTNLNGDSNFSDMPPLVPSSPPYNLSHSRWVEELAKPKARYFLTVYDNSNGDKGEIDESLQSANPRRQRNLRVTENTNERDAHLPFDGPTPPSASANIEASRQGETYLTHLPPEE
jgi:hypothetical protein